MPVSYQRSHDRALAKVAAAGSPVSFVSSSGGTDPGSGIVSGAAPSTLAGKAVGVKGNLLRYQALGLTESQAVTLLFVPASYGAAPALDASVVWGSDTFTVKHVEPIAPDGVTIAARVVLAR